jgi:hypothetical protein
MKGTDGSVLWPVVDGIRISQAQKLKIGLKN